VPQAEIKISVQDAETHAMSANSPFHSAHQPNWWFDADANMSHAFGIFMAYVGALQPSASGAG